MTVPHAGTSGRRMGGVQNLLLLIAVFRKDKQWQVRLLLPHKNLCTPYEMTGSDPVEGNS
jgi:hypothetical protein